MQLSGTEFAKAKEDVAAIMRAKQAAGEYPLNYAAHARRGRCDVLIHVRS